MVEQAAGKVIGYSCSPKLSDADMDSLVQGKAVAEKIFKSVVLNFGFIVPIAENVERMMARAIDDFCLHHMEEASTTTSDDESSMGRSLLPATRPTKIPSSSETHREPSYFSSSP